MRRGRADPVGSAAVQTHQHWPAVIADEERIAGIGHVGTSIQAAADARQLSRAAQHIHLVAHCQCAGRRGDKHQVGSIVRAVADRSERSADDRFKHHVIRWREADGGFEHDVCRRSWVRGHGDGVRRGASVKVQRRRVGIRRSNDIHDANLPLKIALEIRERVAAGDLAQRRAGRTR